MPFATTSTTTTMATTTTNTNDRPFTESPIVVSWETSIADTIRRHIQQQSKLMSHSSSSDTSTDRTNNRPYMVAIAGIPGSGKSTSAMILAKQLEEESKSSGDNNDGNADEMPPPIIPLCMPMDGYHYSLETLHQMMMMTDDDKDDNVLHQHTATTTTTTTTTSKSSADSLLYRRGAPDTFDVEQLRQDLHRIRYGTEPTIALPGFDHARGDPQPNQHVFHRHYHSVLIVEGLYLLLDDNDTNPRWSPIKDYFDMTIYIDADMDACMDRLKIRNQSIPGYTVEEILVRVDAVDRVNAMTVHNGSKHRADHVVVSVAASK